MADKKVTDLPLLDDASNSSVYVVKDGVDYQILSGDLITENDAPTDGSRYVRQNGSWVVGAAVDSVNGKTGVVVLDSDDVGAVSQTLLAVPDGVATLDSTGKLTPSQVPNLATARTITVADEAARLALAPYPDLTIAYQSDTDESWGLNANADPSVHSNWTTLGGVPTSGVVTFNSRTGIVSPQVGDYTADMITETARKFVSDLEKSVWNSKQDALVSGVNIKTVNGQSVVGGGNITINNGAVDSVNGKIGDVVLTKVDIGLSNVDNTSDLNKPISTATQLVLDGKQDELVSGATIKTVNGETILGSGDLVVNGAVNSVNGMTGTVVLSKTDIGLSNVDNTSDINKPISSATQLALDDKQDVLQSGINIKTVNGQSILGSGNIDVAGGGASDLIRTPVAISPLTGTSEFPVDGTLQASAYAPLYSVDAREFREFQIDLASGDFTAPISAAQVNADTWVISPAIPDNTDLKWRCRDKSVNGDYSEWAEPQAFKTYDIYVVTPVILSPTEGGAVTERDQPITSSAFQIVNSEDTHTASFWTIKNSLGSVAYQTGRDTVNLTSWQPPLGVIVDGESMTVEVVYESSSGFLSEAGVRGFVGVGVGYGKYLLVQSETSSHSRAYAQDVDSFINLNTVSGSIPAAPYPFGCVSFSPDGARVCFSGLSETRVFDRNGDSFTAQSTPLFSGISYAASFSPDNAILACAVRGSGTSGGIRIYTISNGVFALKSDAFSVTFPSFPYDLTFSSDGVYLAAAFYSSPYVKVYKRDGNNNFTELSNVNVLPGGSGYSVKFSPDTNYLVVGTYTANSLSVYKRTGDSFVKLNTATPVGDSTHGIAFSGDGSYFVKATRASPFLVFYKNNGDDTFTKIANPTSLPPGQCNRVVTSSDGQYVMAAMDVSPFVVVYKRTGAENFTKLANPDVLPGGKSGGLGVFP